VWKIVRDEFRQVDRLRGMKCFPGGDTQFVGNTMHLTEPEIYKYDDIQFSPSVL